MKKKLVFFDIDGTLAVPRYLVNGEYVPGFSEQGWIDFCKEKGAHSYDDCLPVEPTRRYAEKCKEEGKLLFVLSTAQSPEENAAKAKFVIDNFEGLFQETILVTKDSLKIEEIEKKAKEYEVKLSDCELVEDTFSTLWAAYEKGIQITHVSHLVWNL